MNGEVHLKEAVRRLEVNVPPPGVAGMQVAEISVDGAFLQLVREHQVGRQRSDVGEFLLQTARRPQTARHGTEDGENGHEENGQRNDHLQQGEGSVMPGCRNAGWTRGKPPAWLPAAFRLPKLHRIASTFARPVTHSSEIFRMPRPASRTIVNSSLVPLG